MEEERARQEAAQKRAAEEAKQQEEVAAAPAAEAAPAPASPKKSVRPCFCFQLCIGWLSLLTSRLLIVEIGGSTKG
jgi:hypothetical protein